MITLLSSIVSAFNELEKNAREIKEKYFNHNFVFQYVPRAANKVGHNLISELCFIYFIFENWDSLFLNWLHPLIINNISWGLFLVSKEKGCQNSTANYVCNLFLLLVLIYLGFGHWKKGMVLGTRIHAFVYIYTVYEYQFIISIGLNIFTQSVQVWVLTMCLLSFQTI